ncbi:MAG: hypothetical protein FWG12_07455 [Holophagaceae bacterium]|nr:hypothetical protein [Holophagaceae bacterium]
MAIDSTCPNCNSNSTQSVAMLIGHGTFTGKTTGIGVGGAGFSGGLGLGVGVSSQNTKMMSDLAKRYVPPRKPDASIKYILLVGLAMAANMLVSVVALSNKNFGAILGCGGILFIIPLAIWVGRRISKSQRKKIQEWEARVEYLQKLWLCNQCGHEWIPGR